MRTHTMGSACGQVRAKRFLEGVPAQAEGSLFFSFFIYRLLFLPSPRPAQKRNARARTCAFSYTDETHALLTHGLSCTGSRARALVHGHSCTCSLVRMSLHLCVHTWSRGPDLRVVVWFGRHLLGPLPPPFPLFVNSNR